MFKVVPDQLRVSEGWVRCGQCNEIFDASAHLQQDFPAVAAGQAQGDSHESVLNAAPQPDEAGLALDDGREDEPPMPVMQAEAVASEAALAETEEPSPEPDFEALLQAEEASMLATEQSGADAAAVPPVSFMREVKPRSVWRRPLVRAALMLSCLVLTIGLAVQVIVHERDRIVATEPAAKPWIQAICAVLRCSLSPLRKIESIVIDSSSFNKIRGDVYRLNFTLKNTALTGLAMPAIELALTDSQDRPVLRRVFLPAEFGVKSGMLAADAEATGSLALSVKTNGAMERIAGYRVLAFYP